MKKTITLTTQDGLSLVGVEQHTDQQRIALLFHMMPATKESWDAFAERLLQAGYASIAIDQRGHGESTMQATFDYKQFSDEQQQAKRLDVDAVIAYAITKGFVDKQIILIGASIGANLAMQALVDYPEISCVIALSPGIDYHGVRTDTVMTQLHPHQHVLLIASDDDQESYESIKQLHALNPKQTEVWEQNGIGHGTSMLQNDPLLIDRILRYLVSL